MKKRIALLLFFMVVGVVWAGDYEDGEHEYFSGQYATAIQLYKAAGMFGDHRAQYMVGSMYSDGKGVVQDDAEAARWMKLAAAQGYGVAQNHLAVMYKYKKGVERDFLRAHMWFNLSSASGYAKAERNREAIEGLMTPLHIAEAQKMARECQAHNFKNCD